MSKTIFSGLQPSGALHIGNYLGAIKQWVELGKENTAYYCIVDNHAITVDYDVEELPGRILDTAAWYVAAGLDPEKSVIFVQSHVAAHTDLAWLLGTQTPQGELARMIQFKDKSAKQKSVSLGLFTYPVLMAADILLYGTEVVPVGEDQKQHIELTRDIAKRFNNKFGEVFKVPEAQISKDVARIMSLTDPAEKMSKSGVEKSYVALSDTPEQITKKIMGATTDTEPVISFEKSGPAVLSLLNIYAGFSDESKEEIDEKFADSGYGDFKKDLAELVVAKLKSVQEKYKEIRGDEDGLRIMLARGKHRAEAMANVTLQNVKEKMGLL